MTKDPISQLWQSIKAQFNAVPDLDDEQNTILQIKKAVSFRGANSWVLVFAIFIASLGLNVNSTAVIIGAMLISPLMGPIIGIGLGLGIMDLELLHRSARNYLVTTIISIVTATIYFLISPLSDAQPELLARTSPSLYDVLIALFGGAAGILALATGGKGNVIPGVAIATALMPPLCTAGYGIATGNMAFFLGAFFLYFINTVFISLSTFVGVRMMKFKPVEHDNTKRLKQMQRVVWGIVIATMGLAAYLTVGIVHQSFEQSRLNHFVKEVLAQDGTHIVSSDINPEASSIDVIALGREIDTTAIAAAQHRLGDYRLDAYRLNVIQGTTTDSIILAQSHTRFSPQERDHLLAQIAQLQDADDELQTYKQWEELTSDLAIETRALFPKVSRMSIARTLEATTDSASTHTAIQAIVTLRPRTQLTTAETTSMRQWLQTRTHQDSLHLIIEGQ